MNKFLAILLILATLLSLAGCANPETPAPTQTSVTEIPVTETPVAETAAAPTADTETKATEPQAPAPVLSHEDFRYADIGSLVAIESFVQGIEHSREGQVSLFCQFIDGGYYLQNMACSEEDIVKLVPGTKIRAAGIRSYEKGQIKLTDGSIEILDTLEAFFAEPTDVTGSLDSSSLSPLMHTLVASKSLTVAPSTDAQGKEAACLYDPDSAALSFILTDGEFTLPCTLSLRMAGTGADSQAYQAVSGLQVGDTVDVEGFLYWHSVPHLRVTAVTSAG